MRVPEFDPSETPDHRCACCKDLAEDLSKDEVESILELRWQLLHYFRPLGAEARDVSQRNIFWSTADALYNNPERKISRSQAVPIIIRALQG